MLRIEGDICLITEGDADRNFLLNVFNSRLIGFSVCTPFPYKSEDGGTVISGVDSIGRMLGALRAGGEGFQNLKGVIVVVDSGDDPAATFKKVCKKIKETGGYGVPSTLGEIASSAEDHPPIAVVTIPSPNLSGSLETLYVQYLESLHSTTSEHIRDLHSKDGIEVLTWNAEKQAKSKYATMVALVHKNDPSRAATWAFRNPSVVDVKSQIFDEIVGIINRICENILAL